MITIKPTFWRRSNTIYAVVISAIGLSPLVLHSSAAASFVSLGSFVVLTLVVWLAWRSIRLEITETKGMG
jgi:hypothetical protein